MRKLLIPIIIPIALVMLMFSSCISFNTTGYNYLSKEQKQKISKPSIPLGNLTVNDTIYTINDTMVKEWLDGKEYAIVHSFLTWCKGEYCLPPSVALKDLQDNPLPFLMIAGDFESKNGFTSDYPYMCIDFDYYKTKSYSTGIEKMYRALGCGEDWWELYFLFNNGEYVGSAQTLADLMKIHNNLKKAQNS